MRILDKSIHHIRDNAFEVSATVDRLEGFQDNIDWDHIWIITAQVFVGNKKLDAAYLDRTKTGVDSPTRTLFIPLYQMTGLGLSDQFHRLGKAVVLDAFTAQDYRNALSGLVSTAWNYYQEECERLRREYLAYSRSFDSLFQKLNNIERLMHDKDDAAVSGRSDITDNQRGEAGS